MAALCVSLLRAASRVRLAGLRELRPFTASAYLRAWNQDWKPGPYPKTAEERVAAAKKYGLRPEDYEPYPDDGTGYGDYPKLKLKAGDVRDPYEDWDDPYSKRNFGETLHVFDDIATEERYNPDAKYRYTFPQMFLGLLLITGTIIGSYLYFLQYPFSPRVMPKQYPDSELLRAKRGNQQPVPVKHYTFESLD